MQVTCHNCHYYNQNIKFNFIACGGSKYWWIVGHFNMRHKYATHYTSLPMFEVLNCIFNVNWPFLLNQIVSSQHLIFVYLEYWKHSLYLGCIEQQIKAKQSNIFENLNIRSGLAGTYLINFYNFDYLLLKKRNVTHCFSRIFFFILQEIVLFFSPSGLLRDCSLSWDHLEWYSRRLHLTRPCLVALGRVLIWVNCWM